MPTTKTDQINFLQRIEEVRVELQNKKLSKSGTNKYSNYTYFELKDFLPYVNELCREYQLFTRFYIQYVDDREMALLDIIDTTNPENKVTFAVPTAEVEIGVKADGTGGAQPIQNLGGKVTYMRRYLVIVAFEITEDDAVDTQPPVANKKPTQSNTEAPTASKVPYISTTEGAGKSRAYFAKAKEAGIEAMKAKALVKKKYKLESYTDVSRTQLDEMIKELDKKIESKNTVDDLLEEFNEVEL